MSDESFQFSDLAEYFAKRREDLAVLRDDQGELLGNSPFRHQAMDEMWSTAISTSRTCDREDQKRITDSLSRGDELASRKMRLFIIALYNLRNDILQDKAQKAAERPVGPGFDERVAEIDELLSHLPDITRAHYIPLKTQLSMSLYLIRRNQQAKREDNLLLSSIVSEIVYAYNFALEQAGKNAGRGYTERFRERLLALRENAVTKGYAEKIAEIDTILGELIF